MSISEDFQNRITELAEETDITKSKLAQHIGVDNRVIANALNYGIVPTPRSAIVIADFFQVSLPYLLGNTDDVYFVPAKKTETFSTRFQALCAQKGVTYYRVAQDCHFEKSYPLRWRQKYIPSWEFLEILCDYFDVSLDYLVGRTDDRN